MAAIARNLVASGRRQRLVVGVGAAALGVAAATAMLMTGADRGLRLALFLPFVLGALGLLQARDHT